MAKVQCLYENDVRKSRRASDSSPEEDDDDDDDDDDDQDDQDDQDEEETSEEDPELEQVKPAPVASPKGKSPPGPAPHPRDGIPILQLYFIPVALQVKI